MSQQPPPPTLTSWSDGSLRRQQEHLQAVQRLEAQKIAATLVDVPTLPHLVRDALRQLGVPVRRFGENLANVRDRLKWEIAIRKQRSGEWGIVGGEQQVGAQQQRARGDNLDDDDEAVTKYTRASGALVEARKQIAEFSLARAQERLLRERQLRQSAAARNRSSGDSTKKRALVNEDDDDANQNKMGGDDHHTEVEWLDRAARKTFRRVRNLALEGSQYCDQRAVSCLRTVSLLGGGGTAGASLVVAGTWTASIHVMDASLQRIGSLRQCHDDRIMAMDALNAHPSSEGSSFVVATASLDKTAKLFRIRYDDDAGLDGNGGATPDANEPEPAQPDVETGDSAGGTEVEDAPASFGAPRHSGASSIDGEEVACLRGHAARLGRVAFHPLRQHVATTSFDHTWRLWDVETSECLLLQDGHARECYGVGFHPDGSLVATTDLGGIVHLWDLRTSKSVAFYKSHAGKVLNAEFHPNGFHLGTAGEDGCVHVWDVRRRTKAQKRYGAVSGGPPAGVASRAPLHGQATGTPLVSIPAHSGIVTGLRFDASGEFLCTSSFDGTVKLWSCRSWKLLNRLQGHQGKVTSVDVIQPRGKSQTSPSHEGSLRGIVTSGFDKTVKLWV